MTNLSPATQQRLLVAGTAIIGVGGFYLGLDGWGAFISALHRHEPLLVSDPFSSSMLVLSLFVFSIALIASIPAPAPQQGRRGKPDPKQKRLEKWGVRWLVFGMACIAGAFLARPAQFFVTDAMARGHGYVTCPSITLRHDDDRWALPGVHDPFEQCPHAKGRPIFGTEGLRK